LMRSRSKSKDATPRTFKCRPSATTLGFSSPDLTVRGLQRTDNWYWTFPVENPRYCRDTDAGTGPANCSRTPVPATTTLSALWDAVTLDLQVIIGFQVYRTGHYWPEAEGLRLVVRTRCGIVIHSMRRLQAVRVTGRSMLPVLRSGDVLLCEADPPSITPGEVLIFSDVAHRLIWIDPFGGLWEAGDAERSAARRRRREEVQARVVGLFLQREEARSLFGEPPRPPAVCLKVARSLVRVVSMRVRALWCSGRPRAFRG
jgi:hypothetical protein